MKETIMLTRREAIATIGAVVVATRASASAVAQPVRRSPEGDGGSAKADETTLKGDMVCARCYLNKPDAKECQDVLLVQEKGATVEYYVTKNKVSQDSGEACTAKIPATIVGTVSETDGRKWITATKITKH
jgi:hypothetical protein